MCLIGDVKPLEQCLVHRNSLSFSYITTPHFLPSLTAPSDRMKKVPCVAPTLAAP